MVKKIMQPDRPFIPDLQVGTITWEGESSPSGTQAAQRTLSCCGHKPLELPGGVKERKAYKGEDRLGELTAGSMMFPVAKLGDLIRGFSMFMVFRTCSMSPTCP